MNWARFKRGAQTGRPAHTLLFITEVKTFRVDADRKGIVLNEVTTIEQGCKSSANLAKAFARVADHTGPLGRKVWLLYLRLPSFLLSLPSLQVRGIDAELLKQAIGFEAEGMTGVSSQEVAMTYHFLRDQDDMSDYWVTQIDRLAWEDLQTAIKQRGAKLGGLLHPGALPVSIHSPSAPEWLRIEAWSTQLVAVLRNESHLSIQTFSFESNHWQTELEQWLEEAGKSAVTETLLNNKMEMLPDTQFRFTLKEELDLNPWLALWAKTLITQRQAEIALLRPTANINPNVAWMVGSGMAALVLCGLHAGWYVYQRQYYEEETRHLTEVQKNINELSKQFGTDSEQREALEKKLNKIEANANLIPDSLRILQQRPAQLLKALAEGRDDQLIIESLQMQGVDLVIQGVILELNLASKLAGFIDNRLKATNWKVTETPLENLKLFDDSPGPWTFKMKLVDQGIPGLLEP